MTDFCEDRLKRDGDWGLERLFSNSCQKRVLFLTAGWMFLH